MARLLVKGVILVTVSGCVADVDGPSPSDPHLTTTTAAPTTTSTTPIDEALDRFRGCLADAGVDIAEITYDGRGRPLLARAFADVDLSDRLVAAALAECTPVMAGGALDLSSDLVMRAAVMEGLDRFADCVRSNGVPDFPDPSPRFSGVGSPFPDGLIPWVDDDLPTAVIICNRRLTGGF